MNNRSPFRLALVSASIFESWFPPGHWYNVRRHESRDTPFCFSCSFCPAFAASFIRWSGRAWLSPSFGIITPVLSVVLSVFMLGLAVGRLGGRALIAGHWSEKTGLSAVVFYAGAELLIGLGAFAVPKLFAGGRALLLADRPDEFLRLSFLLGTGSGVFHSALVRVHGHDLSLDDGLRPGAGSPEHGKFQLSLSGQCAGRDERNILTAVVLVELLGFRHTLWVAAAGNFTIAVISGWLAGSSDGQPWRRQMPEPTGTRSRVARPPGNSCSNRLRQMDFIFNRVLRDGHGSGLDSRVHAGFENAGVFLCLDCFHLSGRHLFRLMVVSPTISNTGRPVPRAH